MFKENQFKILLTLVLILLLTNWLTWSASIEMRSKINGLQGKLDQLNSKVSSEVSGVRSSVEQMKNDARWWTPAEVEFVDVNEDRAQVRISWSLREYRAGSKVMLSYQKPGEQKYTQIAAEEESQGHFSVSMPIDIPREPIINLQVEKAGKSTGKNTHAAAKVAVQETSFTGSEELQMDYYISVQDGATIRTSERFSIPLSKLSYSLFSPVHLNAKLLDDGRIMATVHHDLAGKPRYEIRQVYLESRKDGDSVVEKWSFELDQKLERGIYHLTAVPDKDYEALFLVIKYSGNIKVEKKIL